MNLIEIDEKAIYGISARTSNTKEMNPQTARIGKTWQSFDNKVSVDYQNGERVYGVYYNYESDDNGEFDVLAGAEKESTSLDKAVIQKGKYVIFEGKSKMPDDNGRVQAVLETWGKIWQYFGDGTSKYKRAYRTDFEYYKNQTDIDIYISII